MQQKILFPISTAVLRNVRASSFCSLFFLSCLFNLSIVSNSSLFVLVSFIMLFSFLDKKNFCSHPIFSSRLWTCIGRLKHNFEHNKKHLDFISQMLYVCSVFYCSCSLVGRTFTPPPHPLPLLRYLPVLMAYMKI